MGARCASPFTVDDGEMGRRTKFSGPAGRLPSKEVPLDVLAAPFQSSHLSNSRPADSKSKGADMVGCGGVIIVFVGELNAPLSRDSHCHLGARLILSLIASAAEISLGGDGKRTFKEAEQQSECGRRVPG
jgi:hypothetical protein